MHLTLVFQERFALHEKYGESRQHSIFDAVACRITGKPWVFDFSDRLLEKSQHYPKTQCHRLHVDVTEEILLYPQAKL